MKKILIVFILCIAFVGCNNKDTSTNSNLELTQPELEAYQTLLTTAEFAGTAVGFAGSVPRQVPAFQKLLQSEHSVSLFSDLQQEATTAGQIYGLCGLYLSDKETFNRVIPEYQNNHDKVRTFFGCIMEETEIALLIPSIEDGSWPNAFKNCTE